MSSKAKSISGDSPFKPQRFCVFVSQFHTGTRLTLSHYLPGRIRDERSAAAFAAVVAAAVAAAAVVKGDGQRA